MTLLKKYSPDPGVWQESPELEGAGDILVTRSVIFTLTIISGVLAIPKNLTANRIKGVLSGTGIFVGVGPDVGVIVAVGTGVVEGGGVPCRHAPLEQNPLLLFASRQNAPST